jgi:hypothetical protein
MMTDTTGRRATRLAKFWVDLMWWAGLVGATILAVFLLASPLLTNGTLGPVTVHVAVAGDTPVAQPRALQGSNAVIETKDDAFRLEVRTDRPAVVLMSVGPALLLLALMLTGIRQLRQFLTDVLAGLVFTAENARRLSRMAWLALGLAVCLTPITFLSSWLVLRATGLGAVGVKPGSESGGGYALILGLVLLVLASVWRYGAELQRERDLTV